MNQDVVATIAIPSMFAWFAWVIFSTIRRYKIAKLQAEVQTKLLDKVGSGQELLAYAQTEAGRELLESPTNRNYSSLVRRSSFVAAQSCVCFRRRLRRLRHIDLRPRSGLCAVSRCILLPLKVIRAAERRGQSRAMSCVDAMGA